TLPCSTEIEGWGRCQVRGECESSWRTRAARSASGTRRATSLERRRRSSDPVTGVTIKASVAPSPISTSRRNPTQRKLRVVTLTGKKTTFIRPSFEERVDEFARVEVHEIGRGLAEPD